MKTRSSAFSLASVALLVWTTSCNKQPDATTPGQAQGAAATMQETGTKMANDMAAKAAEVTAAGSAKAQELIDSAKKLVGEGKFQDALAKLKATGGEKLSVNQQAMVDTLKAQIEKAIGATSKAAADASAAAGGIPKK